MIGLIECYKYGKENQEEDNLSVSSSAMSGVSYDLNNLSPDGTKTKHLHHSKSLKSNHLKEDDTKNQFHKSKSTIVGIMPENPDLVLPSFMVSRSKSKNQKDILTILISHFDLTFKLYDNFGMKFNPVIKVEIYPLICKKYEPMQNNFDNDCKNLTEASVDENLRSPTRSPSRCYSRTDNSIDEALRSPVRSPTRSSIDVSQMNLGSSKSKSQEGKVLKRINYKKGFKISIDAHQKCKIKFTIQNEVQKTQSPIIIASNSIVLAEIKNMTEINITLFSKMVTPVGELCLRFEINKSNIVDLAEDKDFNEFFSSMIEYQLENINVPLSIPYALIPNTLQDTFIVRKLNTMKLNVKDEEKSRDDNGSRSIQINKVAEMYTKIDELKKGEFSEMLMDAIKKSMHVLMYGCLNIYIIKLDNWFKEKDIKEKKIKEKKENLDETIQAIPEEATTTTTLNDKVENIKFIRHVFESFQSSKECKTEEVGIMIIISKNYVLAKTYFQMLYKVLIFYKFTEKGKDKFEGAINYIDICALLIDAFRYLHSQIGLGPNSKKTMLLEEEWEEIHELLIWIINSLILTTCPVAETGSEVEVLKKVYEIRYVNSLKLLTEMKYIIELFFNINNSECTSLLIYLTRKTFQNILDYKNNYLSSKKNISIAASSIRQFLIDQEKSGSFLMFIQWCLIQYFHYSDLFSNLLIIVISLVSEIGNAVQKRKVIDVLNVGTLCKSMHIYTGKFKGIGKMINLLFLQYLSYITELSRAGVGNNKNEICLKNIECELIATELLILFKTSYDNVEKRFQHSEALTTFLQKKELEMMELIISITTNLSKNKDTIALLTVENCYLIPCLIEFIFSISVNQIKAEINKTPKHERDKLFIQYLSIFDGTAIIFDNLLCRGIKTKEYFTWVLALFVISKNNMQYHYKELLQIAIDYLNDENEKLRSSIGNFVANLQNK